MAKNTIVLFFPRPWPGKQMAGRLPYSLLHLASYLERKKDPFEIILLDERVTPDIQAEIEKINWEDVICAGVSSFTGVQIKHGMAIVDLVRGAAPGTPVVWGGWHPSLMARQTIEDKHVDIAVRGLGEETFRSLIYTLRDGLPLGQVFGINYKENGELKCTPDKPLADYLGDLRINYKLTDVSKFLYRQPWADKCIGMITSLGCPYNCSFCSVVVTYNRKTFFRDLNVVMDEIEYLMKEYGINGITFDDDNFLVHPQRIKDMAKAFIARGWNLQWDAGAHVNILMTHFSDDDLKLLRDSGCRQLYIGAESGSDEVLEILNKRASVESSINYVERMCRAGIRPFLSTMVAFPGMGDKDLNQTMEFILRCKQMDPTLQYRLFYYTPYPGTALYKDALAAGMEEPKSLVEWSNHTLRKFKAPWIREEYRQRILHFYFYYFPYSSGEVLLNAYKARSWVKKAGKSLFALIFQNRLFVALARYRTSKSFYKYPIDAYFVVMGMRLKSKFAHAFLGSADMFADYDTED